MTLEPDNSAGRGNQGCCLAITVQASASHIRASDGKEIPFTRAVLSVSNRGESEVIDLSLQATLGQEGGTVQDVTRPLSGSPASLPPNESISWDVYDRLLPAHSGTASKVNMFGYRAVLNWKFDLAVRAEYRRSAVSPHEQTPLSRWILRWHVPDAVTGAVELAIEEGKD